MLSWDHMDSVLRARSLDDVKSATARFVRAQGFSHHGYAARFQEGTNAAGRDYVWFEDFGNEWSKTYPLLATPRFERSDARILQARAGLPAAAWNSRGESSYVPPARILAQVRRTLQMAGEFGVHGGVTVPSWAPGVDWSFMTFAFDATCDPREMTPTIPAAVYYVSCLQATLNRLLSRPQPVVRLSMRECEVLRWCAIGKTSWEISAILRISERTVNFHLQRIAARLGVKGRRAACARAVALGLITL